MKQEEYRSCMTKNMGGGRLKGLSKEDRKIEFCAIAKQCSKGLPYEEAEKLCAEAALIPKAPRAKSKKGALDITGLANCIIMALDGSEISQANLVPIIAGCTGQKVEKGGRENFIKRCFKKNAVTGDIREAQKLRTMCSAQWKEQEARIDEIR